MSNDRAIRCRSRGISLRSTQIDGVADAGTLGQAGLAVKENQRRQGQFAKRFRLFGDENGVMDGALCRRRKKHRRELPVNRRAGMASAWLSPITAVVLVGLDQGWRAGGVHERRNPTPCRDAEIPKPLVWRGLERRRAAGRHRMDVVPVRWRAALVCVFGRCKRGVLRSPGHASCTAPDACLPAVTAIGLPTQASRSRPISAG